MINMDEVPDNISRKPIDALDPDFRKFIFDIAFKSVSSGFQPVLFFTLGQDYQNLAAAVAFSREFDKVKDKDFANIQFCVEMSDSEGLPQLLDEERSPTSLTKRIHGFRFGAIRDVFSADIVIEGKYDKIAKSINDDYGRNHPNYAQKWDKLDFVMRDSNRQAADHSVIKMKTLGYGVVEISNKKIAETARIVGDADITRCSQKDEYYAHKLLDCLDVLEGYEDSIKSEWNQYSNQEEFDKAQDHRKTLIKKVRHTITQELNIKPKLCSNTNKPEFTS